MTTEYASLCFLSFNRAQFIEEAIRSATENAGFPCEVIVHDDGSDPSVHMQLLDMLEGAEISQLILHPPGHNEGVGAGINRCFKIASGDPVIKLDQDLLFTPDWLARVVGILKQDDAIGMLGLFKYHHEPVPWERMRINVPTKGGYHYTRQFCGSGFAIPRRVWETLGPLQEHSAAFAEDMDYMQRVRFGVQGSVREETMDTGVLGRELALPDVDLVSNRGFGIGPSTVVVAPDTVQEIHTQPHLLAAPDPVPLPTEPPAFTHDFRLRFDVGVVITTCAGREENLVRAVSYLQDLKGVIPHRIVILADGGGHVDLEPGPIPVAWVTAAKHQPGMEQPRNAGFRTLRVIEPDCNYVWFLDSDLIVPSDTLERYYEGLCAAEGHRILIGPYDWLPPGQDGFVPELQNDPRWVSFNEHTPDHVLVHDLGAGLANFGGNLVWPAKEFERVGGFHPDLHHGRCEDGELGLRAASEGIPMSFVADARAWHVWHPVDNEGALEKNARDVPLLNSWHPWVEQQGLLVTAQDGARFDWRCPECGEQVNSLHYWQHSSQHRSAA